MRAIVIGPADSIALPLDDRAVVPDATSADFDGRTETWEVRSSHGTAATASLVVDARPSHSPVMASHGVPNYFRLPGPDTDRQCRYVARCLRLVERTGAARIEAKGRIVLRRGPFNPVSSRFYLSGPQLEPGDVYDGPAGVDWGEVETVERVRLTGHLDAIDGRYHWQGTIFASSRAGVRGGAVTLTVGERTAAGRVVEQTPWGTSMVTGVGAPPFDG